MFMAGGVRGFIRKMTLDKEKKMRVGEAMGACVMAFLGFDTGFWMEWNGEKWHCEAGSAVVVEIDKQEFASLNFIPEKANMPMACVTGVLLNNHDFGKFVGVHFLERGEGTCKARLDIRPEHMNQSAQYMAAVCLHWRMRPVVSQLPLWEASVQRSTVISSF
ncbi:MAG: hypothetical protein ACLSFZ_01220 [Frisingicoccus sp.]